MDVLVLGGTQFVGRHIVEALVAAEHRVTVFNRGIIEDPLPPAVARVRGDRDLGAAGLRALKGASWDACVDVSGYTARQVRASAELLRGCIGRYVFISAVSVYGDPRERPVREEHPRVAPAAEDVTELDGEMYGRLKVTCENIVQEVYGDGCALLRPQIVVGPHDPSGRYTYWLGRVDRDGTMLAPGDGSDHVQVIDARDVGRFVRIVLEQELGGSFNLSGARLTWREFLGVLGARDLAWVPAEVIAAAGVRESELPLFRAEHGPRSGLMDVSNERARAAGLTLTEPATTASDVRTWMTGRGLPVPLSRDREQELLRLAQHRREQP
jgi:2'-hydroxyisoflavone reductase